MKNLIEGIAKYWLVVFFLTVSCTTESQNEKTGMPKSYIAYHTDEIVNIDGKTEEDSWGKVPWSDNFIDIEGVKTPKYKTRMKMMWDDVHLYFYAELEEPHIWANLKKRDTVMFYNNDFEIFIDPDGDTQLYYEFEMNALNSVWDLILTKPYRDSGVVITNWDFKNAKTAVHIDGTLNNPNDTDKKWCVEIAFPWKSINETYNDKSIAPRGKTWRINFSRVNWEFDLINNRYQRKKDPKTGKFLDEYNWVWSPQGVINMHEPEKWGYVYFSEMAVGQKDAFEYGKDELFKSKLYELHRLVRAKVKQSRKWDLSFLPEIISVENKEVSLIVDENINGYTISATSPFTGKVWHISQEGKIWNQK